MRRAVWWLLPVGAAGVAAGYTLAPAAPAICMVALDLDAATVTAFTSDECPADPDEPFTFQRWQAKTPFCPRLAIVTTTEGPKVVHPCKE